MLGPVAPAVTARGGVDGAEFTGVHPALGPDLDLLARLGPSGPGGAGVLVDVITVVRRALLGAEGLRVLRMQLAAEAEHMAVPGGLGQPGHDGFSTGPAGSASAGPVPVCRSSVVTRWKLW